MQRYKITNKKILIYGAGSVGKVVSNVFNQAGVVIEAYIDKRADFIQENNNKEVLSMNDLKGRIKEPDDYVIMITIRNVFEHFSLAEQFFSLGFKNIIYKPITILRGNTNVVQDSINYAYEQITGKFIVPNDEIACYEKEVYEICDFGLQKEYGEEVLVKIPAELLFSNTNPKALIWSCQNFYSNYIAVDLYEAFNNVCSGELARNIDRYIERFALPGAKVMGVNTNGAWREILIDSRQKVYQEMEYKLWMDYDFFIQNCTKIGLRDKKGFELISSGKNRVSFLISKGFQYIPVKISKDDYQKYINLEEAEKIIAYLNEIDIKVFAPIPHPFFYKITTVSPDYAVECVKPIARFLAEQVYLENEEYCFGKYHLGIGINDEGYMGRYFKMLGYEVERTLTKNCEFSSLIDALFYYIPYDFNKTETRFYCSIISNEMKENIVQDFISRTDKFLIMIFSDTNDERDFIAKNPEFRIKKEIFETIWAGEKINGNVYERIE